MLWIDHQWPHTWWSKRVGPRLIEPYALTSHSICNSIFNVNCNYTLFSHIVTTIMICNVCLKNVRVVPNTENMFSKVLACIYMFLLFYGGITPSTRLEPKKEPNLYCIIMRQWRVWFGWSDFGLVGKTWFSCRTWTEKTDYQSNVKLVKSK